MISKRKYNASSSWFNDEKPALYKDRESGKSNDKFLGIFGSLVETTVGKLETEANSHPNNVEYQRMFLRAVLPIDPEYVVKRFESRKFATDDSCREIYYEAIARIKEKSDPKWSPQSLFRIGDKKQINQISSFSRFLARSALAFIILFMLFPQAIKKTNIDMPKLMGFGNSFEEIRPDMVNVRFSDVKGNHETKQELLEIVDFLKNPERYKEVGCRISSGVLMVGPPGTGKTMMAKAIAGEANVPFYYATGSEFDEMYVGVGASRIRKLFAKARETAPCIIFIDELDAVGAKRVNSPMAPYSRMTLNQLLTEMDGFKENNVVLIGATNDPQVLDPALVRAGRFDTRIDVPIPCYNDRVEIIDYYLSHVTTGPDIDVKRLAALTPGASGADLSNLVNQAAVHAVSRKSRSVSMADIDWARDKILMGRERKAVVFSDVEKRRIADHEAGHTIIAYFTKGARKLHKATILPRGSSLGTTHLIPERDEYLLSYEQLLAHVDVAMGGRAAEELLYGPSQITTGCSSDLAGATSIAKNLVAKYGYSKEYGLNFIDSEVSNGNSTELDIKIHDEVKKLLDESYKRAVALLRDHQNDHKKLSDALIKYETLDQKQIDEILS